MFISYNILPVNLFINNQATIKLVSNFINYFCNKHNDIQYHKVQKIIKNCFFQITYILKVNIVIDKLTKLLDFVKFKSFGKC